jgi:hypothetical protein
MQVDLTYEEWQQVINLMAHARGLDCIPMINKVTAQVQRQANGPMPEVAMQKEERDGGRRKPQ